MQHINVGEEHARLGACELAAPLRRIAIVSGEQRLGLRLAPPQRMAQRGARGTQLVLREGLGREGEHCGCTRVRRQKFRQRHQEARRLATRRGTGDRHAARAAAN